MGSGGECWHLDKPKNLCRRSLCLLSQAARVPVEHLAPLCREGVIYLAAGLPLPGSFLVDPWKQRLRGGSSKDEVIGFALRPEILAKPDGFNKTKLVSSLFAQTGWFFFFSAAAPCKDLDGGQHPLQWLLGATSEELWTGCGCASVSGGIWGRAWSLPKAGHCSAPGTRLGTALHGQSSYPPSFCIPSLSAQLLPSSLAAQALSMLPLEKNKQTNKTNVQYHCWLSWLIGRMERRCVYPRKQRISPKQRCRYKHTAYTAK